MTEESKAEEQDVEELEFESGNHGSGTNLIRWPDLKEDPEIDPELDEELDEIVWEAVKEDRDAS